MFPVRPSAQTAPAEDSRRTFSFGGGKPFFTNYKESFDTRTGVMPYRQTRRFTRQMTVSGDSNISYTSRRTFSFGGGISHNKHPRRLPRQMTVSGDSGYRSVVKSELEIKRNNFQFSPSPQRYQALWQSSLENIDPQLHGRVQLHDTLGRLEVRGISKRVIDLVICVLGRFSINLTEKSTGNRFEDKKS